MLRVLTAAVALVLAAGSARGDDVLAPSVTQGLTAARALSMGAVLGVAPGNEGIFFNAAALNALRRYTLEAHWVMSRAGDSSDAQFIGGSVVDSQITSVGAGLAYDKVSSGPYSGSSYMLALSFPVAQGFYLGAAGKLVNLDGPNPLTISTADASLYWSPTPYLSIGAAGYNLIPVGHRDQVSRGIGAGVGFGTEAIRGGFDWRGDFDRRGAFKNAWAVGAEYLAGEMFPVRAGYLKDDVLGASFWSAGTGIVTGSGVAIDAGYRQGLGDASNHRAFAVTLKLFLPAE